MTISSPLSVNTCKSAVNKVSLRNTRTKITFTDKIVTRLVGRKPENLCKAVTDRWEPWLDQERLKNDEERGTSTDVVCAVVKDARPERRKSRISNPYAWAMVEGFRKEFSDLSQTRPEFFKLICPFSTLLELAKLTMTALLYTLFCPSFKAFFLQKTCLVLLVASLSCTFVLHKTKAINSNVALLLLQNKSKVFPEA